MVSIKSLINIIGIGLITISIFQPINGYRILGLFQFPGLSHFNFFHPILRELANQGHDITVVSHFPDSDAPDNYVDIPLPPTQLFTDAISLNDFNNNRYFPSTLSAFHNAFLLYKMGIDDCEKTLSSPAIQKILNTDQPFDLIIMEHFNTDCLMGLAWKLKAPVIAMSSCALMPWHYERIGMPLISSFMPVVMLGYSDQMTLIQRLNNWFVINSVNFAYRYFNDPAADKLINKYLGSGIPSVTELTKQTKLLFVNQHYSLSGVKPLSPAVIELGGIHIKKQLKPLDKELQELLDSATDGVIYVSWGSTIRATTLPDNKRNELLMAFGSFKKQTVLWKFGNETLLNQPKNLYIRNWMPQQEILCHPNVKVFLSHGGLLGMTEAVHCGVPMVITPIFGDQKLNAAALVGRGMGKIVTYDEITKESISDGIEFALNSSTQLLAEKMSYVFRNRPQKPMDTAIWWIEHVIKTNGYTLTRSNAIDMPVHSYYLLDVYAVVAIICLVFIIFSVWIIKQSLRLLKKTFFKYSLKKSQ